MDDVQLKAARTQALDLVRLVKCQHAHAGGSRTEAARLFAEQYPHSLHKDLVARFPERQFELESKAAIAVGNTTASTWAAPLAALQPLADGFTTLVRAESVQGKIPFRRVPMNSSAALVTAGASVTWVGQGEPVPLSALALTSLSLPPRKAGGIAVVSNELLKFSTPDVDIVLRDELIAAMARFLDEQLLDAAITATTQRPASLTNGADTSASAGGTEANARTDLRTVVNAFATTNVDLRDAWLIMSPQTAVSLALTTGSSTLTGTGGTLYGFKVATSVAAGSTIVAVDASQIQIAEDAAGLEIETSRHASAQFDDAPTFPEVAATTFQSLWQRGLTAVRVLQVINWARVRTGAVRVLTDVNYT